MILNDNLISIRDANLLMSQEVPATEVYKFYTHNGLHDRVLLCDNEPLTTTPSSEILRFYVNLNRSLSHATAKSSSFDTTDFVNSVSAAVFDGKH